MKYTAVQMKMNIADYLSKAAFERKIRGLAEQACASSGTDSVRLLVFPEYVGLLLVVQGFGFIVGKVTSILSAIKLMALFFFIRILWLKLRYGVPLVTSLFLLRQKSIARTYFEVFSNTARDFNTYIVAGSVILPHYEKRGNVRLWKGRVDGYKIYNTSFLFGPNGEVIGSQDKVHLTEAEGAELLNISQGSLDNLQVFDTELGRLGIAICLDAFWDDVIERLSGQNADVLIQPSANPKPWDKWQQEDWLRSCYKWTYEQKKFKLGINPFMTGGIPGLTFFGQSSVLGCDDGSISQGYKDLPAMPGFLKVAGTDDKEEVLTVSIVRPETEQIASILRP